MAFQQLGNLRLRVPFFAPQNPPALDGGADPVCMAATRLAGPWFAGGPRVVTVLAPQSRLHLARPGPCAILDRPCCTPGSLRQIEGWRIGRIARRALRHLRRVLRAISRGAAALSTMIVLQLGWQWKTTGNGWLVNQPSPDCPPWAINSPALQVIEGGRKGEPTERTAPQRPSQSIAGKDKFIPFPKRARPAAVPE
jgi:hypothetical protein